jgi:hypothetical protein
MPFSKYTVESGLMEVMRAAFHRVCVVLQLNCSTEDRLTEIVVSRIVELAKAGERDPQRLCDAVLSEMEATQSVRSADAADAGSNAESAPADAKRSCDVVRQQAAPGPG